jgi:hypothetical protein
MNRGYFFTGALIVVLTLCAWVTMSLNPLRHGDKPSFAHASSGLLFSTNYPVNMRGWISPHEIAQPDGGATVVLHEKEDWRLLRHWPSGYIDVAYRKGDWIRNKLSLAWRRSQIPLLGFASTDAKSFYLVTYDAVTNIPSGRTLKPAREGLDLYRITPDSQEEPVLVASALQLGGFDTRLFARQSGEAITLCGGNRCLTIDSKGVVQPWTLDVITNHEIIELVFADDSKAYALTRLQHDDRQQGVLSKEFATYYVFALSPSTSQSLGTISEGGIPWGLTIEDGAPHLRMAKNAQDMRALLQYELSLMPFAGVMDYGSNNLEGRVAWSSVYYLNGLISLTSEQSWLPITDRDALRKRLARELELIARLGQTKYPDYLSKRYSVDREPMLVALHVGRVLQLISRAKRYGITSKALVQAQNTMCETLTKLESTLEESRILPDQGTYLFYRKGFPFWGDGANVPYNYVSGLIAGRLEAGCITASEAGKYLQPILQNEFNSRSLPEQWRYWWGKGDDGWTEIDQVSLNTPSYKGNGKAFAHISYRSMDVAALLLYEQFGGELPPKFSQYVERLIERGTLYPSLNEILASKERHAVIGDFAAHRFARAISPWELQNQAWALDHLATKKIKD